MRAASRRRDKARPATARRDAPGVRAWAASPGEHVVTMSSSMTPRLKAAGGERTGKMSNQSAAAVFTPLLGGCRDPSSRWWWPWGLEADAPSSV